MKEFIAETGGRHTYAEDILNLQELALSLSSIFTTHENFIISGCEISETTISPGFVWLNGKIRYFEGQASISLPYYIVEYNTTEMVVYANDVNKKGRENYSCTGSTSVPTEINETGIVPQYIAISTSYTPRVDKFWGRYSVLLETPFSKQTIKKDLDLTGNLSVAKVIESRDSLSVIDPQSLYCLKAIANDAGCAIQTFLNGSIVNEINITDTSIVFHVKGEELVKIDKSGIHTPNIFLSSAKISSLHVSENSINNISDNTDEGAVNINTRGLGGEKGKYRNFNVYNGRQDTEPIFQVQGKKNTTILNGSLKINTPGEGVILISSSSSKEEKQLVNTITFADKLNNTLAKLGYMSKEDFIFSLVNKIGDISLCPKSHVDIQGDLLLKGINIVDTYLTKKDFIAANQKKVDVIEGKQLSTEDFTTEFKRKLDAIATGSLEDNNHGFVTSKEVAEALNKKLSSSNNLSDLNDSNKARQSLNVYSIEESDARYLKINSKLLELVSLSADEVNGLSAEQAAALKAEKQQAIRSNIDAEKQGTGSLKLEKKANLSDLTDTLLARKNLQVYSIEDINNLLDKKLGVDSAYSGVTFTQEMRTKLQDIKNGTFAYTDAEGKSHAEIEGFLLTSQVKKELAKKADRLLGGNSTEDQKKIASNLNVYNKQEANDKFTSISSLFQDYINYLTKEGNSTERAQEILREKLSVLSKEYITNNFIRNDSKLTDLKLPDAAAKKIACKQIGAAYAEEYQTKITDTGWLQMENSGSATDTRTLYVRQIGNIVSIQGTINTSKRDGDAWGGIIAILPNKISAPKYGVRTSHCDYNDSSKYNRGASFVIPANGRKLIIYASGWNNRTTEINFSYMI